MTKGKAEARFLSGKMKVELKSGAHTLVSDVSEEGENAGPSPQELICMGLAACTSITLRMYAQRKGFKLTDAQVTVEISKEDASGSVLVRRITLIGDLNEAEKMRLLDIANHNPVLRMLSRKIEVLTEHL
ncbi:MAG: OsmC family protein [Bacteriovorax sp.]